MIQKKSYSSVTVAPKQPLSEALTALKRSPVIRRARPSRASEAFDSQLAREAPDFATLMVKLYGVTNKMADALAAQSEYTSKDINALTALVKALPTLQEAEKNHKAKLNDKAPEDMSTEDLWEALQGLEDVENSEFPLFELPEGGSTPSE